MGERFRIRFRRIGLPDQDVQAILRPMPTGENIKKGDRVALRRVGIAVVEQVDDRDCN